MGPAHRLPADDLDLWTRVTVLQWRYRRTLPPRLDDCGVLRRGDAALAPSALESHVMTAVLKQVGDVDSMMA